MWSFSLSLSLTLPSSQCPEHAYGRQALLKSKHLYMWLAGWEVGRLGVLGVGVGVGGWDLETDGWDSERG